MANVDKSTRILNFVSSDSYNYLTPEKKENIINDFMSINDRRKPITFRNVSRDEIEKYFEGLNYAIKKRISDFFSITNIILEEDGNNNQIGADLNIKSKDNRSVVKKVELKFGSETNRNIGNNTMDKIFSILETRETFTTIFQRIRIKQQNFVDTNINATESSIDNNLNNILNKKVEVLNQVLVNEKLTINSETMAQLLVTTGSLDLLNEQKSVIKLSIQYNENINSAVTVIDTPNVKGYWEIKKIEMAPQSTRVVILVENNFIQAKFLLNWKNNKEYKGKKYAAKLGLGSVSWNVWINTP